MNADSGGGNYKYMWQEIVFRDVGKHLKGKTIEFRHISYIL